MRARATLGVQRADAGRSTVSRITSLRSHAPLVLRPTLPKGAEPLVRGAAGVARVSLAAGAAGPLGGDEYSLDVHVARGSTLVLNDVSATLVLPGARGGRSRMRITIRVDDDATLIWMPEPIIAARGCDHVHEVDVELATRARFLMREEVLLGRLREPPGRISQRTSVRRDGRPLYVQRLDLGGDPPAPQDAAVTGGRRCLGTVLAVDPDWSHDRPPDTLLGDEAAVSALSGPAMVITAVADDTRTVRRLLDSGLRSLGDRWSPAGAEPSRAHAPARSENPEKMESMS
jgi:urease accessory protein